jgi:transcriptional regulator with XRE-family HTH domain
MSTATSPVVKGWELGLRLRERREQLGLTATSVAKRIPCTQTFISMTEAGRPKLTAARLAQLCRIYDIDTDEAAELEQLRLGANEKAWWQEYSGLFSAELQRYFGFEAGAEQVRSYHTEVVHGLLQTEDYARAVIAGGSPYIRLTEVDRRVSARMLRQARLIADDPLHISCVMGESALLQQIGGPRTMRAQLEHMAELCERKSIDIRVVPFSAGAHPALGAPFEILSFHSARLRDIAWQEVLTATDIVDAPDRVNEYVATFGEVARKALSAADSRDLMWKTAKELE